MGSQLGTEEQNNTNLENADHQAVVKKVMEKWLGEGFPTRSNEGQGVQAAISKCEPLQGMAKSVAPTGKKFDVENKALSDRVYAKYGGGNKMSMSKESLSDRKYKK